MTQSKTALVTGGAQGIGRAIAQRLCDEGYQVVVVDIDEEAVNELQRDASLALHAQVADVSSETAVQYVFQRAQEKFGRLDVLINNAAIVNPVNAPVDKLALDDWNRIIATNLTGPLLCTKAAVPLLRITGGSIINIASTRALQSEPNTEIYAASKGGLVALTHALAISLGPIIRVNCISPGWISTEHLQKKSKRKTPAFSDADHYQHPVGRVGRPEDVAAMVAYLASSDAGFITGLG